LARASAESQYEKSVRTLKALDVVSGLQLQQARRSEPGRPLQISGLIQGLLSSGETRFLILSLVDNSTVDIHCQGEHPEVKTGSRVRCLVKPADASGLSRLELVDITWDKTPLEVLAQAARAAMKIPVKDKEEITRSAAELAARSATQLPARGADYSIVCKRAISYLNPRLSAREVSTIADSILAYCSKYQLPDPFLVVAVIAAESRFNPNARSYKGAAGLGQLMPATAAAHGVNPYDPVANLELAVRIIRRNLDKYGYSQEGILKALAAYNAGTGAVQRYGGVPPYRETRNYLWTIYEYWCWLHGSKPVARPR
jgi:ribosomal protein L32E